MSQFNIELNIILPLFNRSGFFVEVGGNHPIRPDITWFGENLDWEKVRLAENVAFDSEVCINVSQYVVRNRIKEINGIN